MYKVIIVDDSKTAQLAIKTFLKKTLGERNFDPKSTITCESGEETLEKLKSFKPDFMTVDVIMTGMDGIELSKKILEDKIKTKIIIISSKEYKIEILQKEVPLVKAIIKKPITLEKFKSALEIAKIK